MQSNIAQWLPTGVHGLLIFGSTGEFPYVEDDERRAIMQAARAAIPAQVQMLAGCGAESTQRTLRYLDWAAEDGAEAALVVTPVYYTRGKTAAQRQYFLDLAENSPIPVLLYSVSPFTAYDMPVDLILELAQHPNIAGIKDSSGDLKRAVMQANAGAPDFAFISGNPNLAFPALAMGAAGSITAFGNIIPELFVGIWQAVQAGDMRGAAAIQIAVTKLHDQIGAFGVGALKAILTHRGFTPGRPRPPLQPLAPDRTPQVIAAWERAMAVL